MAGLGSGATSAKISQGFGCEIQRFLRAVSVLIQNGTCSQLVGLMARSSLLAVALAVTLLGTAEAKEIEVMGHASIRVNQSDGDVRAIRTRAQRDAKRQAVMDAIEKVLGPGSSQDPRVASKIDAVVSQISDERVVDGHGTRVGDTYEFTVKLILDDQEFRTLLTDLGIALNTSTVRAYSILVVMDEFLTTERDLHAPLEELEEFSSEKGARLRNTTKSSSSKTASSVANSGSSVDARLSEQAHPSGNSGQPSTANTAQQAKDTNKSLKSTQATSLAAATDSRSARVVSVEAEAHDNVKYKKLIRYQPHGGQPEKTSQAYNALVGQLQAYDLRVLDNDVFRSKYFKDTPLTIEKMQNGEALSKYVSYANSDAKADFFMVGNSIIIDSGKNPNTGDSQCTGVITVKTYSTVDGEAIASETFAEGGAGTNVNDCAARAAKKLARVGGPVIGARIQDYWKRRITYGREYVVTLSGINLPLAVKTTFTKALRGISGIENETQRSSGPRQVQFLVTYKGTELLDQALASSLSSSTVFSNLDSRTVGNQITLCMGPCEEVERALRKQP